MALWMVMAEFVDARIGDVDIGVIHHGIALVVRTVQGLKLKVQGPPRKWPIFVVEQRIDWAGVIDCPIV